MEQWASLAQPAGQGTQVAAFFGVTPAEDAGQPVRLALALPQEEAPAYAEAASVPISAPEQEAPVYAAATVSNAVASELPVNTQAAPYVMPPAQPVQAVAAVPSPKVVKVAAPSPRPVSLSSGQYVVQIGAFSTRAQAQTVWRSAQKRFGFAMERQMITTVSGDGKGVFHRLAASGFASQAEAARACKAVKAKGGDCFVRSKSAQSSMKIAARR